MSNAPHSATPPLNAGRRDARHLSLDIVVTRARVVESRHRVHAAVVSADGAMLAESRDAHLHTWWRSCAKPFQVMPMLADGSFDSFGWGDEQLALACASHGSEPEHVAVAAGMLRDAGLTTDALACGPHDPLSRRGAELLRQAHQEPTRLHSNCSGKHSAMLARAVARGWPTDGYQHESHPVQLEAWQTVAEWAGLPTDAIARGVDGCGVTVFALPLYNMALAYARFAAAVAAGDAIPARIARAMTAHPHLVGGTDRFDTVLMRAGAGRIMAKVGAEGVHSVALLDRGIGIALKVEDGAPRAQYPAVLACLQAIGALPDELPPALAAIADIDLTNTRSEVVGTVRVGAEEVGDAC